MTLRVFTLSILLASLSVRSQSQPAKIKGNLKDSISGQHPFNKQLDTVIISNQKRLDNLKRDLIGVQKISINELKNLPVLFGEKDILKSIQLLPGIKNAGEGSSGFFVRGGSSDQNLILLDGTPVNNASRILLKTYPFTKDPFLLSLVAGYLPY